MHRLIPLRPRVSVKLELLAQTRLDGHIVALTQSPLLHTVAAASVEGQIGVWDVKSSSPNLVQRFVLPGHVLGTMALAWQPDGRLLMSAGQDGQARGWDMQTGQEAFAVEGGSAWVEHLAWCEPADRRQRPVLVTAAGRKLRMWDMEGHLLQEYSDHAGTVAGLAWHARRQELAAISYGVLALHNLTHFSEPRQLRWQGASLAVMWSPDGRFIATGDQDATVHFWLAQTGEDLQMWGYPTKVRELSWDRRSRYLATGGGATAVVWDCSGKGPEGTRPTMLEHHEEALTVLAFQNRGRLLASGGRDGRVVLWQPEKHDQMVGSVEYADPISQLVWSSDDRTLMVGTAAGEVDLYRVTGP